MVMRCGSFFTICLLLILPHIAKAQVDSTAGRHQADYGLKYRTFRVALVPGISSNGIDAPDYASKYSLNLLAGYNGALERGFELGGLVNINKYYARGGQLAGIANYSGKETAGIQLAGLLNYAGSDMQGIQLSGFGNISRNDMQGLQFAGTLNWASGYAEGLQASGVANISGKDMSGIFMSGAGNISAGNMQGIFLSGVFNFSQQTMQGIMAAGVMNYSDDFQGIALGGINVNRNVEGIQIGNINVARDAQGIQVGLINYAKNMDGLPVGLISYYENGRKNFDTWTSDAGFTNVGVKLGTHEIYNMISIGYNPFLDGDVWQVGWSIGRLHQYDTHFLYTDFSYFKINEGHWTKDLNSMFKYRLLFGKKLINGLQVYGGPTLNMLISRQEDSNRYTWYRLFDFGAKGRSYVFWIGYSLGIQLF